MRLYDDEINALNVAIENVRGEVYIFGSRVDDTKKGGDIDVLIFSKEEPYKLSQQVSLKFSSILNSKLDVIVFDKDNLKKEQQAFINTLQLERIK